MRKRFLNKKMSPFFDQAFPENILPHLRIKNKAKKLLNKRKVIPTHSKNPPLSTGKSRAMKKLETEIIKQFSKMSISDDTTAMRTTDLFFSNSFFSNFKAPQVGVPPVQPTRNAILGGRNFTPPERVVSSNLIQGHYPSHLGDDKVEVQQYSLKNKTQSPPTTSGDHLWWRLVDEDTKTKDIYLRAKSPFPPHFSPPLVSPVSVSTETGDTKGTAAQSALQHPSTGYFLFSHNQLKNEMIRKQGGAKNYSQFKMQLRERRKLSVFFGNLCKRDLRRTINKLDLYRGKANENLLMLLETRLDVALKRCFFFTNILSARQYVNHGKICVNGKTVTRPSYQLHPGDIISVSKSKNKAWNVFTKNHGKDKNPVSTNLLIKDALTLEKSKQYLKNVKNWGFIASPFLMQLFSKIQLFMTRKAGIANTKREQNKTEKSGVIWRYENYDTCFVTANYPEVWTHFGVDKEYNSSFLSMKKRCCLTFQDTSNFSQFDENLKLSVYKKLYDPLLQGSLNSICEQFAQDVCSKTANIVKKKQEMLTQSGMKIEASQKLFFFPENSKFYNLLFYLLIKQYLSFKEQHSKRRLDSFRLSGEVVKKMKTLHFEISHKSLSAIFLYWPQKLYFPAPLDLDLIRKSFQ